METKKRIPWNKGKKGLQVAWNKGLPKEQQPRYGKHYIHSEETRKLLSEKIKEWHRTHPHPKGMLGKKASAETKKKMSEAHKGEKNSFYGKKHTEETKRKMSESHKGHKPTKEWRKKASKRMKGSKNPFYRREHTLESRKKMSEAQKKNPQRYWLGKKRSPRVRKILRESRLKVVLPRKDTKIEVILQNFLKELNIPFEKHKPLLNLTQPDIFIEPNIVIYADGCYWHNCEVCFDGNQFSSKQRAKKIQDILVTEKLIREGYIVLRFWEHHIKEMILEEFERELLEVGVKAEI